MSPQRLNRQFDCARVGGSEWLPPVLFSYKTDLFNSDTVEPISNIIRGFLKGS